MKRLLLFLALFAVQVGFAQEIRVVDLSNQASIELGETLTRAELIERLGNPQSARESFDDEITMTTILRAHFKDNLFVFSDMALYWFSISNPYFEVIVNDQYRVKVGDKYSEFITSLPEGSYYIQSNEKELFGIHWKTLNGLFSDCSLIFRVESDTIRSIVWDEPI